MIFKSLSIVRTVRSRTHRICEEGK